MEMTQFTTSKKHDQHHTFFKNTHNLEPGSVEPRLDSADLEARLIAEQSHACRGIISKFG